MINLPKKPHIILSTLTNKSTIVDKYEHVDKLEPATSGDVSRKLSLFSDQHLRVCCKVSAIHTLFSLMLPGCAFTKSMI